MDLHFRVDMGLLESCFCSCAGLSDRVDQASGGWRFSLPLTPCLAHRVLRALIAAVHTMWLTYLPSASDTASGVCVRRSEISNHERKERATVRRVSESECAVHLLAVPEGLEPSRMMKAKSATDPSKCFR